MRLKQGDTMRDEICNLRLIFGSWRIRTADLTLDLPLALAGCEFLIESSHFNSRQNSAPDTTPKIVTHSASVLML
jgi:hypothetical protein